MNEEKRIGIAGVGNYILADEGFGVHVVHYLQNNYDFPDNVDLQDVGTAGIFMAPFFEECDPVFVIDVVDIEGEPGSFHHFNLEAVKAGNFQLRMSPHQLGLLEILEVSKLRGAIPGEIEFYTVIPKVLEEGIELSDVVDARKVQVAEMILTKLTELGVKYRKKQ
jgi:hydrogenase maturation protease